MTPFLQGNHSNMAAEAQADHEKKYPTPPYGGMGYGLFLFLLFPLVELVHEDLADVPMILLGIHC